MSEQLPVHVVCAVIRRADGAVFAVRRPSGKRLAGMWEFPGGKVEAGEGLEAALEREIREELGIGVTILRSLTAREFPYDFGTVRIHPFLCSEPPEEPQLLEHTESLWLPPDRLGSLDWVPADRPIIREIEEITATEPFKSDQSGGRL
jgi:8-oxo-dGTP diphosphatase